jgi:hypothetical protein
MSVPDIAECVALCATVVSISDLTLQRFRERKLAESGERKLSERGEPMGQGGTYN